ncbi:MAG: GNAT family N-acetyltransferase [Burkholderiales bacterium]
MSESRADAFVPPHSKPSGRLDVKTVAFSRCFHAHKDADLTPAPYSALRFTTLDEGPRHGKLSRALSGQGCPPGLANELCSLAETIEISAWRDIAAAVPPDLRRITRFEAIDIGDTLVLRASRLGNLLFNRAIGLGLAGTIDDAQILKVLSAFRGAGIDNFWVHVSPAAQSAGLAARLHTHGLDAHRRSWTKFARGPEAPPAAHCELSLRAASRMDMEPTAEILAPAFDMPAAGGRILAAVIGRPNWHVYVVRDGKRLVAVGGLYLERPLAYLVFAATDPTYRRRGAQAALMQKRIETACARGCTLITTETGTPLHADEPNPSFQNMLRFGFHPTATRENYGLPGTQWNRR